MNNIPITHKRCRRCKEVKHRQQFLPRIGTEVKRYDSYCSACRSKNFYIPPNILDQRVKDGLMRPKRREKIREQYAKNKAAAMAHALTVGRLNAKINSWAPALKSLNLCKRKIAAYEFPEGCDEWRAQMQELMARTAAYIKEERTKEKLPSNRVVFWYDVGAVVDEYRALVRNYPLGEDQCPLTIF